MTSYWKHMNSLPKVIRQKTTPELTERGNQLIKETMIARKLITEQKRTKQQAHEKAQADPRYLMIKDELYYSTMDGMYLLNAHGARRLAGDLMVYNTADFAYAFLTVFYEDQWQSFAEVCEKL